MRDELDRFVEYVRGLSSDDLGTIEALPFRRTLTDDQATALQSRIDRRWKIEGQWYPHDRGVGAPAPSDTVAFSAEPFFTRELAAALQDVLRAHGVTRVFELRESPPHREIDLELLRPWYDFREGFWFDNSLNWLVYASHEGAVSVSGAYLLPELKARWRNWGQHLFNDTEPGAHREVGPGISSIAVAVDPPSGWQPPD